ncbi:MAG: hypothetical protein K2X47_14270 [Bdellovibrionales bacterium]|nr:hypothetical protein [Bdellovibrionales bacterium]
MNICLLVVILVSSISAQAGFKEWFRKSSNSKNELKQTENKACDLYQQIRVSSQSFDVSALVTEFEREALKVTKDGKKLKCAPERSELISMLASGYKREACYEKLIHEKYKWGPPKGILGKNFNELNQKYKELTQEEIACVFTGQDWADFDSHGKTLDLCKLVRDFESQKRIYNTSGTIWNLKYLLGKAKESKQNPPCDVTQSHIDEIILKKIGEENCRILEEAKSNLADQYRIYEYEKLQTSSSEIPSGNPTCSVSKDEMNKMKIEALTRSVCSALGDLKAGDTLYGTTTMLARMDLKEIRRLGASATCNGVNAGLILEQAEKKTQSNSGLQ